MDERGLLELKQQVDEAKEGTLRLKGQYDALMQQLKDDWKCGTVRLAQKKAEERKQKGEELQDEIDTGLQELENKLMDEDTE